MASTRKLLHHLALFLCLILVSFPHLFPPPKSNTSIATLSLILVHYCAVAVGFQRWTLLGLISQSTTSKTVADCALVFLQHKLGEKACELFPGPLWLCVIGWIWRFIYLAGRACICLVCVREFIHVCLVPHMKRLLFYLAATCISWKSFLSCMSIAAVNQPLTRCRCEDRGMLNISELLYLEVVTHLEWQE